jgi:hypothetical protein
MKPNLDILKPEIELYLEETGLTVFYGYSRPLETAPAVYWDCDQYPDYLSFSSANFSPSRSTRLSKNCTLANCRLKSPAISRSA